MPHKSTEKFFVFFLSGGGRKAKSQKYSQVREYSIKQGFPGQVISELLGSLRVKAACKTMVKLTPSCSVDPKMFEMLLVLKISLFGVK